MRFLQTLLIATTITYCHSYFKHINVANQTLYDQIVEYFFPKELRNTKIKMDLYLCHLTLTHETCCRCTKTCKYYGICCIDAFFDNSITSVEEYVTLFLKMTNMRRYVSYLPVTSNTNISSYFNVNQVQTVASCENKDSPYASLCNGSDLNNDIRVIADGFVYKNKYCALCHGFSYSFATLNLECENSADISGIRVTVPDKTCKLRIREDPELGYKNKNYSIEAYLPEVNKLQCSLEEITLCYYSYFSVIEASGIWYANPQCAKCNGKTDLENEYCQGKPPDIPDVNIPHFLLIIGFDGNGNYESVLDYGPPVCPRDQYFDIFSNQCKKMWQNTCQKSISSDMNSTLPSLLWKQKVAKDQLLFNHVQFYQRHGNFVEVLGLTSQSNYFFTVPYQEFAFTQLHEFTPKLHFSHGRVCADPKIINQSFGINSDWNNFGITSDCSINPSAATYNITKDVTYWLNVTRSRINHVAANCTNLYLAKNCSMGALNTTILAMKSKSVVFHISNEEIIHSTEQYVHFMEGFGLCHKNEKKDITEYEWLKRYDYLEYIMSIALFCTSILLELLLLTVYFVMKKTKIIPDRILITFCIALLICDVAGMTQILIKRVQSVNRTLCKTVAPLLHFFSLALCTWTCIIAFEFWKIMRSTYTMKRQSFLYLHYSVIAWGVPLIVTSVCLSIDLISNGTLIRYGNQSYCWISPFRARLAAHTIPYFLLSFGSFLSIVIVTLQTKLEKRKTHNMLSKHDQVNFLKMAIKLILLFGTAELIALVHIPHAKQKGQSEMIFNIIFGFIYNFLRSSRGIFTFALFPGKKILEKYKERSRTSTTLSQSASL